VGEWNRENPLPDRRGKEKSWRRANKLSPESIKKPIPTAGGGGGVLSLSSGCEKVQELSISVHVTRVRAVKIAKWFVSAFSIWAISSDGN
jgi:hypothetical protein